MRLRLLSASFLGLLLVLSAGEAPAGGQKPGKAKANDGVITNWGRPKDFAAGKVNAYWVWYDDGVWHLRSTGGGKGAHRFHGRIDVGGGKLVGLKGQKGEYGGKLADRFAFNRDSTAIAFDFKTDEHIDGLNFAADAAATALRFTLALDGQASPRQIRIGRQGDHPAAAAFTVPAHPPDPPDAKAKAKKKKK
jgi:hypothetical protein